MSDFLWKNFFPDEPLLRSLGMSEKNWLVDETYILDNIKKGACVAAVKDQEDVLAVRLGVVKNRSDHFTRMFEKGFNSFFKFEFTCNMLPASLKKTWVVSKLFKIINYDCWSMFDKLGCDRIYDDKAVCSARFHGIKGRGKYFAVSVSVIVPNVVILDFTIPHSRIHARCHHS